MKSYAKILFILIINLMLTANLFADSEFQLNNGIKVYIKPMRAAPVVTVNYFIKNGSIYESEGESGFSELVNKLLFANSSGFSNYSLKEEFEKLGIRLNKNVSNDCQSFSFSGASRDFDRILELSSDGLYNSIFSDDDLKKAIITIKSEIKELESQPNFVVYNALLQEAFPVHPCRRPYFGVNPNFEEATSFILNRFYKKNYTTANTILVITGDVDEEKACNSLRKYLDPIKTCSYTEPELPKELPQTEYREVTKFADVEKVYVNFGWKVQSQEQSDRYALFVLAKLLGGSEKSILWQRLAKGRQTCEYVDARYELSRMHSFFVASAVTSKSKVQYFISDLRQIVNSFFDESILERELEDVKNSIIAEDIFECESVENCAYDLGSFAVLSDFNEAENFSNGIRSVNIEDLKRVAAENLRDDNLTVAILQASPISDDVDPVMLTLENGIKLILKENHRAPVISVSAKFVAGSLREEKRNAGVANLAAELLYRSFDSDDKSFLSKIEANGAKLYYEANKDYVSFDMKSVSSSFIPAFDLFIKMLDKGEFPTSYTKYKKVFEDRLEKEEKDISLLNKYNTLKAVFGNSSTLTYSDIGKLEDVNKLKRNDIIDYYKKNFVPSNLVIAIVGDFYSIELKNYILASLGKISSNSSNNRSLKELKASDFEYKGDTLVSMKNKTDEADIVYISKSAPINSKHNIAIDIAAKILESSLKNSFKDADKSGLMASSVEINNNSYLTDGYFKASVKTNKENIATAAQLLLLEVEAYKISNISPSAVNEIKNRLFTDFALSMSDSLSLARLFSKHEVMGLGFDYYKKYESILASVTVDVVKEAAQTYMLPEKKTVIGIASTDASEYSYEGKKLVKISKEEKNNRNTRSSKESKVNKENSDENSKKSNKSSEADLKQSNNTTKDNKESVTPDKDKKETKVDDNKSKDSAEKAKQ